MTDKTNQTAWTPRAQPLLPLRETNSKEMPPMYVSLGMLVPNSRDRQGKLWISKKQKTAQETNL